MIETERLLLRPWRESDKPAFAALNADPRVRRYFPSTLTRAESDAQLDAMSAKWEQAGFAFGAVVRKSDGAFLGMAGLARTTFAEGIGTFDEIGWRFAAAYWGQGYATEAARAWLDWGFRTLALSEIVAFTLPENAPSRAVMRRLGMRHDPDRDFTVTTFDGQRIDLVFYALDRADWQAR